MRSALAAQGLRVVGQRVAVTDNTLKDLIRIAYQVKDYQISGPPWIATEKYEIAAIMPAGANRTQAPEMLRTLLGQRVHLELHRETRKMAVYALVVAKGGPRLTAAPPNSRGFAAGSRDGHVLAKASPVAAFADLLTNAADRPVVDQTGIAGLYDFDLSYGAQLSATAPDDVEILVIDPADKVPTEN